MHHRSIVAFAAIVTLAGAAPVPTGPEVGKKIPGFSLPDQNGKMQSLRSLAGPKGLVLAFVRSADW
ncbi:MAG: hypothetical protein R2762_24735 [Bryobacteraceae bacterium]